MNKTVSVWLKLEDGLNKGKIALQKRSLKNKIFVFVCQSTWAGKVEPNEDVKVATERECKEELGDSFYDNFDFSILKLISKNSFKIKNENWQSYNYFGLVREDVLKKVCMHEEAYSEFIYAKKGDLIYSVKSKKDPKDNVVLFDDQYKVLTKILNGNKRNNK